MRSPLAQEEIIRALSRIESSELPYPSDELLKAFVTEAVQPALAARYVIDRLSTSDAQSLVSDWVYIVESVTERGCTPPPPPPQVQNEITRRDGGKCCITGKAGTPKDPLVVVPILPVPTGWLTEKPGIFDMLGAFFSRPHRSWWLSYAKNMRTLQYHNHWLLRESAAEAFAQGHVRLDRTRSSTIEFELNPVLVDPYNEFIEADGHYPLLGDLSRSGILKVDARFIGTQARLSTSIRYLNIAKKIAPGLLDHASDTSSSFNAEKKFAAEPQPVAHRNVSVARPLRRAFFKVWRTVPSKVRSTTYVELAKRGRHIYGTPGIYSTEGTVQRLPFGLYLKFVGGADRFFNEFNALQLVRQYTSIPVPEPLDVIFKPGNKKHYLLTTRLPGIPLSRCLHVLSDRDLERIGDQLKHHLSQLRSIPKTVNPGMAICDTLGGPCRDNRVMDGDPVGPFVDEAAFSRQLRFSDDPARKGHDIVFTHGDLNARNILVEEANDENGEGWRVSGIVDWETAGWFPEYWDYTKAMFEGFRWTKRYNNMMHSVFRELGDYSKEFDVETRAWEAGDGV
ncbi:kinase-like domain-containing protein [Diplogelasinospora grovesii]|uniref:Kinase-like domain-containing protein n=1 Tax=Diplogelasinospora grovesii TaxID=303347 RepID=A0AAN6S723_9PEZI|nr:kinase-like domain-containing protein [Diplogelasinospora grovesii]